MESWLLYFPIWIGLHLFNDDTCPPGHISRFVRNHQWYVNTVQSRYIAITSHKQFTKELRGVFCEFKARTTLYNCSCRIVCNIGLLDRDISRLYGTAKKPFQSVPHDAPWLYPLGRVQVNMALASQCCQGYRNLKHEALTKWWPFADDNFEFISWIKIIVSG